MREDIKEKLNHDLQYLDTLLEVFDGEGYIVQSCNRNHPGLVVWKLKSPLDYKVDLIIPVLKKKLLTNRRGLL